MNYFRLGPPVRASQAELAHFVGRTEPAWNETVHACHFGEDGPGLVIVIEREMMIDDQFMADCGGFQQWFLDELLERMYE